MRAHPSFLEIVRGRFVAKYVHKKLSSGLQRPVDFGHQKFIVLHVLEQLDRDDAIKSFGSKFVVYNIACDNLEIT